MSPYGTVHVACSFLALAAGAVVFRLPKGTRWHRTLGHVYAMGMVGVVATALVAESMTRWVVPVVEPHLESGPLWGAFWGTVLVASLAVMAVGAHLVRRRLPASVAGTPAAMRRERARLQALEEGAD